MITKKRSEEVYRKFSPNSLELFYIRRISLASLYRNARTIIPLVIVLLLPFITVILVKVYHLSHILTILSTFIYVAILMILGVTTFIVWYKRMVRIKNICKELNISRKEYNELVDKYYYKNYYPDIKDYINSILPE
jgi:uncharacterized protein YacL